MALLKHSIESLNSLSAAVRPPTRPINPPTQTPAETFGTIYKLDLKNTDLKKKSNK